jgi:hypothetical protein
MKAIKQIIAIAIFAFLFSNCATHSGMMSGNESLSSNNFKIATGRATATKIFGFGGLDKDALVFEAKKDLVQGYFLREGQTLANATVGLKSSYLLFLNTEKITITADIVELCSIVKDRREANNHT